MKVNLTISIPAWADRIVTWPILLYRKHKYGYGFRRIYLGEGEWTILDQEDYYKYCGFKWTIGGHGSKFYAVRVAIEGTEIRTIRLHREIMNAPDGLVVDHINGDSLDNRRANLRLATHTQNMHNRKKRKNTRTPYFGIWPKGKKSYQSRIGHNGERIYLGTFDSAEAAARAYDAAARKYHREYARLNFPD